MAATDTNLYRAVIDGTFVGPLIKDGEPVMGVLYPRFEDSTYVDRGGIERTSPADVTVYQLAAGDEVDTGGGTSMFDVKGWFGYRVWQYFRVPDGTEYPDSLHIRRGKSKRKNKTGSLEGRHYQIEPRTRMTVVAYKGALDNFARNAVVRMVEIAKVSG
jgi:hypothetical protein